MDRTLLLGCMFLSVLGWVFTAALSRKTRAETGIPPLLLICATALPVLIFVLTLPVGRPFAPGQGLGRGFLLGSFGALLASMSAPLVSTRLEGTLKSTSAVAGPWLMSCACNAFAVLFLRAELLDTLMGVAVGWFCAAVLQHRTSPLPRPSKYRGVPHEGTAPQRHYRHTTSAMGQPQQRST